MALLLLQVVVLGVVSAAAHDAPVAWTSGARASLPCAVPLAPLIPPRRPPPPLDTEDKPRPKPYMWWRGDDKISSKWVSPTGVLEVSKRREGAEGVYRCAVRYHGGIVMGYPVHLKFASMEKQFTSHPENMTVRSGQPVTLSCVIGSSPAADVLWLRHEEPLPEDDRYHVMSNQLLITDVASDDEGEYRCIATNPQLNKTRTSHAGRLDVTIGAGDQDPVMLPMNVETDVAKLRGSRVVLPCPVMGWPRPRLIWEHQPPGGKKAEMEETGQVFIITNLEYDQEGTYTCSLEGFSELSKSFNVTILESPAITIPPSGKEALRASTVRFNCSASGRPTPRVSWFKDGSPLTLGGRINVRKSIDGQRNELVISGVTSDDAGVYQCFATNAAGTNSAWALLNVTGFDAAAPTNVRCWPLGEKRVRVAWDPPAVGEVVAYTVHATPEGSKAGISLPGHPRTDTEDNVTVSATLTSYKFQVRAYSRLTPSIKNAASELSKGAICQGQGVPIKMAKLEDKIMVSWKQFAEDNPGVVQWILQHRMEKTRVERNVTLDGGVYNYTLDVSPNNPQQIRVLGSRSLKWLHQDLSLVPWASTANAGTDLDSGEVTAVPQDLEIVQVGARDFTITWRCEEAEADLTTDRFVYMVCVRKALLDGNDKCVESKSNTATFDGLEPSNTYEVRVQARLPHRALGGPFSPPFTVNTLAEGPQRFKDLKGVFINASTLNVSWRGPPEHYTVHYSAQLKLPVEQWDSVDTNSNSVLIHGINAADTTFLMVTAYDPLEHSKIETIPPLQRAAESNSVQLEWAGDVVVVRWAGGARRVAAGQNITSPLDAWRTVLAKQPPIQLTGLDPSLPTYVMVSSNKMYQGEVHTLAPRSSNYDYSMWYLAMGVAIGVIILGAMVVIAICLWNRRKKARSPRHRRRTNPNEVNEEDGAEMKSVGGRLANGGGSKDAGEPLLNGHVHITENPTSKTPNGKMKKGRRYEAAFDVSRSDAADTTLETVLDTDTSSTTFQLLDASRTPELDLSRSSHTTNSFNKLPDDNMNSELTRSTDFQLDNSKIQPTLQPNG